MNRKQSRLRQDFADILEAAPSVINGISTATRSSTNIHPMVLGRRADSLMFVPQAFSFENIDEFGRALCLGETVVLPQEINPFISRLRKYGITVTAPHSHWFFDRPRLLYVHFESIDEPLSFATKVREALDVLMSENAGPVLRNDQSKLNIQFEDICRDFSGILGGTSTFENGICTVTNPRTNIKPLVLGRRGSSFLLIPQMFAFESLSADGQALCSGETVLLEEEVNPFISALRQHNIMVTSLYNRWLFDEPRLMYVHFEKIDRPLTFARDVREAQKILITKEVKPVLEF